MKKLQQTYQIKASPSKVWKALTSPSIIETWTGTSAEMDENVGTAFKLWDGEIYGTNKVMEPEQKIVQDWYAGQWDQPSVVTIKLSPDGNETTINLLHENVPDEEAPGIESGWKDYYFGPIQELFE